MEATFDEKELLDRVDNDMGFLAETVALLRADGPALMKKMMDALAAQDASSVARTAHALKGMVSNFCSPQTQASALHVEQMGKNGDLSAASVAVRILNDRIEALLSDLEAFVKERT